MSENPDLKMLTVRRTVSSLCSEDVFPFEPYDDTTTSRCQLCGHEVYVRQQNLSLGLLIACFECMFQNMVECKKEGVPTPEVLTVDEGRERGWL